MLSVTSCVRLEGNPYSYTEYVQFSAPLLTEGLETNLRSNEKPISRNSARFVLDLNIFPVAKEDPTERWKLLLTNRWHCGFDHHRWIMKRVWPRVIEVYVDRSVPWSCILHVCWFIYFSSNQPTSTIHRDAVNIVWSCWRGFLIDELNVIRCAYRRGIISVSLMTVVAWVTVTTTEMASHW